MDWLKTNTARAKQLYDETTGTAVATEYDPDFQVRV
jgi:hypothetical protein